ncbi:transcription initiation factor TFIID subunit 9 [Histoplasma capsulatum var. duboisii H88]|uniref:Transcription initiation factor TFIID subunit 9 n=2 Tax=Ajellomyces capsulatus TaxID=5037 RepID=A0A8H7YX27_AJECA|nr:transcription initiation factor TFIID subunit 9 [Histoplasma capsulatum]QSS55047.1 transcription initiation factor TFIID subunit 9 [Histoplasma capsulatum var. duboisii H88]QSS73186.1 transcription initiation factor TFIID subunit 9 [Histoplasma capsulatum G186AR]
MRPHPPATIPLKQTTRPPQQPPTTPPPTPAQPTQPSSPPPHYKTQANPAARAMRASSTCSSPPSA